MVAIQKMSADSTKNCPQKHVLGTNTQIFSILCCSSNLYNQIFSHIKTLNLSLSLFMCHLLHGYCPSCEFGHVSQWRFYFQSPSHPPSALCCGCRSLKWWGVQARLPERGRKRSGEVTFPFSTLTSAPLAEGTHYGPKSQPGKHQWPLQLFMLLFFYRNETSITWWMGKKLTQTRYKSSAFLQLQNNIKWQPNSVSYQVFPQVNIFWTCQQQWAHVPVRTQ